MVGREEPSGKPKTSLCEGENHAPQKNPTLFSFLSFSLFGSTPLLPPHSFSQFPFFFYSSSTPLFFFPRFGSPTFLCSPLFLFFSPFSSRLSPSVCFFFSFFYPPLPLIFGFFSYKISSTSLKTWESGCVGDPMSPTVFFLKFFYFFIFF